ncbi:hypothetical protein MNBD_ALPHA08-1235 [hydrothermal vent metagenome]|uniref:Pyrrolidone-carboxylate peptidase n=1 Tax=hydrothermal vent metagenome TaxID=652676 RepID=A0A3B0RU42_9ZZZZ
MNVKKPKSKGKPGGKKKDKLKPWKVYVSGFLDWPASELEAQGFDKWRCEENPSGRLMIGGWWAGKTKPVVGKGLLARKLAAIKKTAGGRKIKWKFDVLPVVWGVAKKIKARKYDVVINIGLGGHKNGTIILLEQGAFNRRGGQADADGKVAGRQGGPAVKIDKKAGKKLAPAKPVSDLVKAGAGTVGKYSFKVAEARKTNNYVCNETHYLMLKQVRKTKRLRRAFFIHIPKPVLVKEYKGLAAALAKTIQKLVEP